MIVIMIMIIMMIHLSFFAKQGERKVDSCHFHVKHVPSVLVCVCVSRTQHKDMHIIHAFMLYPLIRQQERSSRSPKLDYPILYYLSITRNFDSTYLYTQYKHIELYVDRPAYIKDFLVDVKEICSITVFG
jgi:hypothetical protein